MRFYNENKFIANSILIVIFLSSFSAKCFSVYLYQKLMFQFLKKKYIIIFYAFIYLKNFILISRQGLISILK